MSGYYYSIVTHEEKTGEKVSLGDYVFRKRHYDLGLDNYQCRVLSGIPQLDPLGAVTTASGPKLTKQYFELVEANLREFYVMVGLTERFDELVVALAHLLGANLADVVYHRQNVTLNRPTRNEIPQQIVAEIEKCNLWDQRLYEIGAELFREIVRSFGDTFADDVSLFKRLNCMFQSGYGNQAILTEERRNRGRPGARRLQALRNRFFPLVRMTNRATLPLSLTTSFDPLRCARCVAQSTVDSRGVMFYVRVLRVFL